MRRLAIVTALLVGAAASAALLVSSRVGDPPRQTGSVTVVGDSLNVGIEPYLGDTLERWEIFHHNVVGRRGDEGLAEIRALGATIAPVLVISLGTNDPQTDAIGFRRLVDDVLHEAGRGRCVIWSTIWLDGPNDAFNDVLRAASRRYENLEIEDWASAVTADSGLVETDAVHGTPKGYAQRATEIARIAEGCHP